MGDHTPGPWVRGHSGQLFGADGNRVVLSNTGLAFGSSNTFSAGLGNTQLVEAAPELLTALQEAERQIVYLHEKFGETGSGNAVLTQTRIAIARATGSTP